MGSKVTAFPAILGDFQQSDASPTREMEAVGQISGTSSQIN